MRAATVEAIRDLRRKRRDIWRSFEQPLRRIPERDTEIQNANAARGGQITSELLPEAQAAYMQIARRRDRELEALGEQHRPAIVRGHDELLTAAATAAGALAATLRQLVAYESEMGAFLSETKQQQPRTAGNQDLAIQLEGFAQRVQQLQAPMPVARRPVQQAPVRPDFSDLLHQ